MGARDPCLVVRARGLLGTVSDGPIAVAAVHEGDSPNVSTFGDDSQGCSLTADLFGLRAPATSTRVPLVCGRWRRSIAACICQPVLLTRLVQVVFPITFHDATRAWRRRFCREQVPGIARPDAPDDPTGGRFIVRYKSLGILTNRRLRWPRRSRGAFCRKSGKRRNQRAYWWSAADSRR